MCEAGNQCCGLEKPHSGEGARSPGPALLLHQLQAAAKTLRGSRKVTPCSAQGTIPDLGVQMCDSKRWSLWKGN